MNACKWHMKTKIISKTNHPERVVWQIKRGFYTKWWIFFFCKSIDAKFVSYKFYVSHNKRWGVFYCSFSFVFSLHSYEVISPIIIIITGCVRNFYVFRKSNDVAPARKKNALCKKNREYSSKDENQMLLERFECAHRPFINFLQASAIWLHAQFTFACSYL